MPTKRTDRESSHPSLPFPTPPGFGEPIAVLIVGVNSKGEAHIHSTGNSTQTLFLATQGLNYAISRIVVEALQTSMASTLGPWPITREGRS